MFARLSFIILAFSVGIITSYEDIKEGKIRNKWILFGFITGACLFLYYIILGEINSFVYLKNVALNSFLAFFIGYLMWQYKLWSAGDAKLFALYAFLLPLNRYANWYLKYFPSFALLVNTFIFAFIFLFVRAIFSLFTDESKIEEFRKSVFSKTRIKEQAFSILKIFPIFLLILLILARLTFPFNQIFLFIPLFFISKPLSKFLKERKILNLILVSSLLVLLGLVWNREINVLLQAVKVNLIRMGVFMVVLMAINMIVDFYLNKEETKTTFFALWLFLGTIFVSIFKTSIIHLFSRLVRF